MSSLAWCMMNFAIKNGVYILYKPLHTCQPQNWCSPPPKSLFNYRNIGYAGFVIFMALDPTLIVLEVVNIIHPMITLSHHMIESYTIVTLNNELDFRTVVQM
jgi:hypothetical protein